MSVPQDTVDPDENVLWYWFNQTANGVSESTKSNRWGVLRRFDRYLAAQGDYNHDCDWTEIEPDNVRWDEQVSPSDVNPKLAEAFIRELVDRFSAGTQRNTISILSIAYDWCESRTEPVNGNPFDYVQNILGKDLLETITGRNAHIIEINEVREYARSWEHPLWAAVQLLFCKLPRRAGGVSNLDIEDINIDHPACDWVVHPDIRHWDDHILFRHDKEQSESGRNTGNKTATTAIYPLDTELKDTLIWYLAIRPAPRKPTDALFLGQQNAKRLNGGTISSVFAERSKKLTESDSTDLKCWYGSHDDDNINPHYWRHWGTTWYQDRLADESLVNYLRGDTGNGSKANYNQYTYEKANKILESMPRIYEPYIDD